MDYAVTEIMGTLIGTVIGMVLLILLSRLFGG